MGIRITVLIVFFSLLYSSLIFKLYTLQIEERETYQAKAFFYHLAAGMLNPVRGSIYFTDKNNVSMPAAINKEYSIIYANPNGIENVPEAAQILSEISGRDKNELVDILSKKDDPYEPIVKKATEIQVNKILEYKSIRKDLEKWFGVKYERSRLYPLSTIASHLLGFVSADESVGGAYGVEFYYNDRLKGKAGISEGDKLVNPAEAGEDLKLTIDLNIQREAEKILSVLVEKYKAQGGTAIVQDPKTGKILAMSNIPTFNPNSYGESEVGAFLNPATQAVYEPGSIFKIITMAAGLDAGKITPDTTYVDTGSLTLNGKTIKNWDLKAHGKITMTQVIEGSVNTGAVFAESTLGHDLFYSYLVKFGLKEKTNIDLPGEIVGSLRPLEVDKRDINFATASFGQGISVTPIGLLKTMSAVANHGVMMKPYVNVEKEPEMIGRVITEKASKEVIGMMVNAVNKAEIAKIRGYNIAGKTGTAQVPDFKYGGYTDEVINTYIGFAPAYDPKFIILLKMDKPLGAPLAGLTIVPAFRDLAQFILNYYNIPPDNLEN
ncbi:MAG: hypothetical protein AUJ39_01370 [Parcubacteria group bacterium CG1_02_42_13]|nr:MAG: hypothetical protein AUJ39_01370 [Parcubacteria group bacterium CG1_02_42_13]